MSAGQDASGIPAGTTPASGSIINEQTEIESARGDNDSWEDDEDDEDAMDQDQDLTDHEYSTHEDTPIPGIVDHLETEYQAMMNANYDDWNEDNVRIISAFWAMKPDISAPDDIELAQIISSGEVSALNHEYHKKNLESQWRAADKTHSPTGPEKEYRLSSTGHFNWIISPYFGTKSNPVTSCVRKSPIFEIGGLDWQLHYFPFGTTAPNHTSLFLTCLSLKDCKDLGVIDPLLPLLFDKKFSAQKGVSVKLSVLMYNPQEPRTFIQAVDFNRFTSNNYDLGWSRFHPWDNYFRRQVGQRAPLLQNDQIGVSIHIHIYDDETGYLWENFSFYSRHDSFLLAGIQSLIGHSKVPRAFVAAVMSWLLLKPFRQLLYDVVVPDPEYEQLQKPFPVIAALQKILLDMRTLVKFNKSSNIREPITLVDLYTAFEKAGIHSILDSCNVVTAWQMLRHQIDKELETTPWASRMEEIFGLSPEKAHHTNGISFRIPPIYHDIQTAVNNHLTKPNFRLPQVLRLELIRQTYHPQPNTFSKVLAKVKINETIYVKGAIYNIYGIITHNGKIQDDDYQAILRPLGPKTGWYRFKDGENNTPSQFNCSVERIPARVALQDHEGGDTKLPIAVAFLYLRDDVTYFQIEKLYEPQWKLTRWLRYYFDARIKTVRPLELAVDEAPIERKLSTKQTLKLQATKDSLKIIHVKAINSKAFKESNTTATGIIDLWPIQRLAKWVTDFTVLSTDNAEMVNQKLAKCLNVERIQFFAMHADGRNHWPSIKIDYQHALPFAHHKSIVFDPLYEPQEPYYRWIWYHILPKRDGTDLQSTLSRGSLNQEQAIGNEILTPVPTTDNDNVIRSIHRYVDESQQDEDEIHTANENGITAAAQHSNMEDTVMSDSDDIDIEEIQAQSELNAIVNVTRTHSGYSNHFPGAPSSSRIARLAETFFRQGTLPHPPGFHNHPEENMFYFLKTWDGKTLKNEAMHTCNYASRIDRTIQRVIGLPRDSCPTIWVQKDSFTLGETIPLRRSFRSIGLRSCVVLILALKPSTTKDKHNENLDQDTDDTLDGHSLRSLLIRRLRIEALSFNYNHYLRNAKNVKIYRFGLSELSCTEYRDLMPIAYQGPLKDFMPHGIGSRIYPTGDKYSGKFVEGKPEGNGRMIYANGDTYLGNWVNGNSHGHGQRVEKSSGNMYSGGWRKGKPHGAGITKWKQAEQQEWECKICWDKSDPATFDCGHVVACIECAKKIESCPLCRKEVKRVIRLRYA